MRADTHQLQSQFTFIDLFQDYAINRKQKYITEFFNEVIHYQSVIAIFYRYPWLEFLGILFNNNLNNELPTMVHSLFNSKTSSMANRSLIVHSLDQTRKYSRHGKEKYSKLLSSITTAQNWRHVKSKQQFRKSYSSSDVYLRTSQDKCVKKFEKLIRQEEELKIASNLNALVKNFLKSSASKKRNVKNLRKSMLKGQQDKNKLSKLLQISPPQHQTEEPVNLIGQSSLMPSQQQSGRYNESNERKQAKNELKDELKMTEGKVQEDQMLNISQMSLTGRQNKSIFRKNPFNSSFLIKSKQITQNRIKKMTQQSSKHQFNAISHITPWSFSQD